MQWDKRVDVYSQMFDRAIDSLPVLAEQSETYESLVRAIVNGATNKKQAMSKMGWGVRVPWNQYRNRLRLSGVSMTSAEYTHGEQPGKLF
jgi:hypothetical protein